ncbi:hypothetical protein RO3G_14657 [Rhizopus delemar RA 99-880]|uniref:Uncharacterized protein n=1 Tax=Rhizopus delemar (strain RA 99-880 / ATCC MYA-4621 / FGSC 9543 / NRRL 43880) TaxID=246409 RepID=I1CNB6_RHIO9|nr:hypothetical protein RO3G_14657 [Rhizopus delemar RA 99-880]|eukprot:EIE89946.1 hypothetical protein RO3G_14657 [Rhizopus delemar RA 99-880]
MAGILCIYDVVVSVLSSGGLVFVQVVAGLSAGRPCLAVLGLYGLGVALILNTKASGTESVRVGEA